VRYESYDRPRCDFQLRGGSGRRLEVVSVRPGGKADIAGVKGGDILASIDGHRGLEQRLPDNVMRSLNAPCSIVFLGFVGKLAAEVRMATRGPPPIGMSPGCKLLSEGWSRLPPPPQPARPPTSWQRACRPCGSVLVAEQVELRPGRGVFFLTRSSALAPESEGADWDDQMAEEHWEAIEAEALAAAEQGEGARPLSPSTASGATWPQPEDALGAASDADAAAGIGGSEAVRRSEEHLPTLKEDAEECGAIFELRAGEARHLVTMALLSDVDPYGASSSRPAEDAPEVATAPARASDGAEAGAGTEVDDITFATLV